MFFLPRFEIYHQNLSTYYLNLPQFIDFLKNDLFTGYIQIKGTHKDFLIFLEIGQILNCLEITENNYQILSLEEILNKVGKEEYVDVYYLPEETAIFWANLVTGSILYPNLSSDFTDLIKLLAKLKDEKLTGWIEINSPQKEKSFVYFQNGKVIGSCCSWKGNKFYKGEDLLPEIIKKYSKAVFDVYISGETSIEEAINFFEAYIKILEEIIGKKEFSLLWRRKGVEKADKYPFLDPFANEFEYKEGKINFWGEVSPNEFIEALKEVCSEIIKEKKLTEKMKDKTKEIKDQHKTFIEKNGLFSLVGS
ncbi:MAG: hypothetical protein LWW94_02075 [Candidatus Desulfofervidaceae bacterium]|nr:hypothetical protein [Candidatus Desulfofervidaceae bacterium]